MTNVCDTCRHMPAYCRCEPEPTPVVGLEAGIGRASAAFWVSPVNQAYLRCCANSVKRPEPMPLVTAFGAGRLLELAELLDAAREEGYEVGYDAAKESVGEWLERSEP